MPDWLDCFSYFCGFTHYLKLYVAYYWFVSYCNNSGRAAHWVSVWGLASHSTHNRLFWRRVFPGNHLYWYWQPKNNKDEIHKTQKLTLRKINWP